MSSLSTPSRLTRSISPQDAHHSSPTPNDLTPRSKIKAMLQAIDDDDSDKENQTRNFGSNIQRGESPSKVSKPHSKSKQISSPFNRDSESEDEEGIASRPRGAMIARMFGEQNQKEASKEDQLPPSDEDAYTRVKRQLMQKQKTNKREHLEEDGSNDTASKTQAADSDSDDELVRSPKQPQTSPNEQASIQGIQSNVSSAATRSKKDPLESLFEEDGEDKIASSDAEVNSRSESESASKTKPNRLQELLARKREERIAKEQAAHHSSSEEDMPTSTDSKTSSRPKQRTQVIVHSEGEEEEDAAEKFTREARPTRKASKKALEEMNRETQRMNRNMQLVHEARTKKKFTTTDFFKKMNFRQPLVEEVSMQPDSGASSSAPHSSDPEPTVSRETPPSSPPSLSGSAKKDPGEKTISHETKAEVQSISSDNEIPSLEDIMNEKVKESRLHKSSSKAANSGRISNANLRKFAKSAKKTPAAEDSDDDLEILPPRKPSRIAVLDKTPKSKTQESRPLHVLRALAHLNGRFDKRHKSMTPVELNAMLQRKGREQALIEKNEKIEALREKGVIVQTEEERERDQMQLETMLERARQEAQELAKREKEAAKADGKVEDGLPDSDDEDEDFVASEEDGDVELSGSDEEAEEENSEQDGETASDASEDEENLHEESAVATQGMVDDVAEEDDADDEEEEEEDISDEEEEDALTMRKPTVASRRKTIIVSDDEDEIADDKVVENCNQNALTTPKTPKADIFGFNSVKSNKLGLSQVFAGTLADTQADTSMAFSNSQAESIPFLPGYEGEFVDESERLLVQDSQTNQSQDIDEQIEIHQMQGPQDPTPSAPTQMSEIFAPSPDVGFQTNFSPTMVPNGTVDTVDTVLLSNQSPIVQRKGRLQRGRPNNDRVRSSDVAVEATPDEEIENQNSTVEDSGLSTNVFEFMKRAVSDKPAQPNFNKKKSKAQDMVEEHAEESDDEYAGLGGASDDESQGELDEETKKMIDDNSNEKMNEREMAAYHADNERAADEKLLERLYKDINNGGFRRKHGADMDLLGSDDEEEAAARRRAAKQREFAKMRKALLADEKIGKIAENPKRKAFLDAIEDRLEGDDWMLLDEPESVPLTFESQSQQAAATDALEETSGNMGKKRKHSEYAEGKENENQSSHERRKTKMAKPTSLIDIRNTLSEIIGQSADSVIDLDSEDEELQDSVDNAQDSIQTTEDSIDMSQSNQASFISSSSKDSIEHHPRTTTSANRASVIDRMALKKQNSSLSSTNYADTSQSRLAFQHPSRSFNATFKPPSLLRRATTNASNSSIGEGSNASGSFSTSGAVTGLGGMSNGKEYVKMGGTKKSSVNYYVRERERMQKVKESEDRRQQERVRMGKMRRKEGRALNALGGGTFA